MKTRPILPIFLCFILGCQTPPSPKSSPSQTPPSPKSGERSGAEYSERHLDFKEWGRTADCCTASGVKAAVASGGGFASKAGIEILKAGGNVVDAAIATAFVLAVERPHSAGLGGGGFMTLYLKNQKSPAQFIDFRETAPKKASRDMYLDKNGKVIPDLSVLGPLSVATPGFVLGLNEIHRRWGKLPWKTLLTPSIQLAFRGFKIYPSLARHIEEKKECLIKDPEIKKLLFNQEEPLKKGDLLIQIDLANTLRRIATYGGKEFKTGKTAQAIARFMNSNQGLLSAEDLENYKVKYRTPIMGKFKKLDFVGAPPPSAGGLLILQMLKVLEGFPIEEIAQKTPEYSHLLSEVMKRAYADRGKFVGDPDFTHYDFLKLVSEKYIEALRKNISLVKATPSSLIQGGQLINEGSHTTHLSVIDVQGNAVASTLTINDTFGACIMAPGTGIFLNDEMDDFSVKPGAPNIYGLVGEMANAIEPLKRPASSMSPTILVREGQPILVAGAAGGSRITTSVLQVILNDLFVYSGDLKKSIFAPRIHQQWMPEFLDIEEGYSETTKEYLNSLGEKVRPPPFSAITQAVHLQEDGKVTAVFDPRDEGGAEAY